MPPEFSRRINSLETFHDLEQSKSDVRDAFLKFRTVRKDAPEPRYAETTVARTALPASPDASIFLT